MNASQEHAMQDEVDTLRAIVRSVVIEELERRRSLAEVLTRSQVADLLRVSPEIVARYVQKLGLPARRIGRKTLRFTRAEVMTWLASQPLVGGKPRH